MTLSLDSHYSLTHDRADVVTADDICDEFLALAERDGYNLDALRLFRLLYLAYGLHLAKYKHPLFCEEFEAWSFGPVIPSIYHRFKAFRTGPISLPPVKRSQIVQGRREPHLMMDAALSVERVWEACKRLSGPSQVEMTLMPGTPWHATYFRLGGQFRDRTIIPMNLTLAFFTEPESFSGSSAWPALMRA